MRKSDKLYHRTGELFQSRDQRDPLDNLIRDAVGDGGMYDGVLAEITFTNGFEKWGAYEGWGQGYQVKFFNTQTQECIGSGGGIYLNNAIKNAVKQVTCEHDYSPLVEGGHGAILCKKCGKIDPNREVEYNFGPDYL